VNILSTLDQMEKRGEISEEEKRDEYSRFCNILHQLIQTNNLSESVKLIEYNDKSDNDGSTFLFYKKKSKNFFFRKFSCRF
jgi:hypothetical protein